MKICKKNTMPRPPLPPIFYDDSHRIIQSEVSHSILSTQNKGAVFFNPRDGGGPSFRNSELFFAAPPKILNFFISPLKFQFFYSSPKNKDIIFFLNINVKNQKRFKAP